MVGRFSSGAEVKLRRVVKKLVSHLESPSAIFTLKHGNNSILVSLKQTLMNAMPHLLVILMQRVRIPLVLTHAPVKLGILVMVFQIV